MRKCGQPSISQRSAETWKPRLWAKVRVPGNPEVPVVENECIAGIENCGQPLFANHLRQPSSLTIIAKRWKANDWPLEMRWRDILLLIPCEDFHEFRTQIPNPMNTSGTTQRPHRSTEPRMSEWFPSHLPTKHHSATSAAYTSKISER